MNPRKKTDACTSKRNQLTRRMEALRMTHDDLPLRRSRPRQPFARRASLGLCLAMAASCGSNRAPPRGQDPGPVSSDPAALLREAWDRVPLVALGEMQAVRQHGVFLERLIGSDALADRFDDIVVEFGSADDQAIVDRYIAGEPVPAAAIDHVLRDTTQLLVWDSPVYAKVFAAVRRANQRRPAARKLRLLLGDPPIDWPSIQTREAYRAIADQRDRHFAALVEREVLARGRKALLLLGSFHALRRGAPIETVASLLDGRRPGALFVVILYAGMGPHSAAVEATLAGGDRPGMLFLSQSWIGSLPARSAFPLPPALELPEGLALRDVADAYLYLGPADSLVEAPAPRRIYRESDYVRELERRYPIVFGQPLDTRRLLDETP